MTPRPDAAQILLRQLVRRLPGFAWLTDRELRVEASSGGSLLAPSLAHDAAAGRTVEELEEGNALFDLDGHRRALAGEHVDYEASWGGRDYRVHLEPLRVESGEVEGCVAVALDVTEQRVAEQALRRSEARFRALIENSIDVTAILAADASIRYASPSVEPVLGFAPGELLGRSAFDLVHPDDVPVLAEIFRLAADAPGSTRTDTFRARHGDGSWRLMEAIGLNLLADPAVRGMVVTARDITARRALEDRLSQSERLEAIGQLAGGIAHDFNNVLLVIRGYSSVLLSSLEDPVHRADVEEIAGAAERAANLTRKLLAFGRRQVMQSRRLLVADVVRDLEPLLRHAVPATIELGLELGEEDGEEAAVVADPAQIEQVLLNLVVNARDAMPAGGSVVVSVGRVERDEEDRTTTPPLPAGAYATLSVADTGGGIPDEVLPHVFEPFFTTKGENVGTGLGLSTVHGIVVQSGGAIETRTAVGRGTTITIYLPAAPAERAEPPVLDAGPEAPPEHGAETVLLVEDEAPVRELVRRALADAGYRVLAAALPSEALTLLAAGEHADLLLSDVVMPEMSGYDLAARVRRAQPEMATLFMSGYAHAAAQAASTLDEEAVLLQKPFAPDELARAVRAVLDRHPRPVAS